MTLVLVRHGRAGDRLEWEGDDRLRPLDEKGLKQARRLVDLLAPFPVRRVVSSPYLRCMQTLEPLAAARGLAVEPCDELGEELQWERGVELLRGLADADAVACGHGGIDAALGFDLPFRKGAVWLFERGLETPQLLLERL
jgi:phosphohistidine phosphatase SixA